MTAGVVLLSEERASAGELILAGAGDIAHTEGPSSAQVATQELIQAISPARVLVFGDAQYVNGAPLEYEGSYDPTWGQFYSITSPAPGDHDWNTPGASGFRNYFGLISTYSSFDLGGWHLIALDSRLDHSEGSEQCAWLEADFAATRLPTIAYFSHPRFSSGRKHGPDVGVRPFWDILFDSGSQRCKMILNGHEHFYERFARMTPGGRVSAGGGIRQLTVGTGGAGLYSFGLAKTGSQFRDADHHGVVKLTLSGSSIGWEWMDTEGRVRDSGIDAF